MSNAVEPNVTTGPHTTDPLKRRFPNDHVPWQLLPSDIHKMIGLHLEASEMLALKTTGPRCPFREAEDQPWRRSCSEGTPLAYHPFSSMIENPSHTIQQKENLWEALSKGEPWSKRTFNFLNSIPAHEKKLFDKLKAPEANGLKVVGNTKVLNLPGKRQAIVKDGELSIREHSGKIVFKAKLNYESHEVLRMAYLENTLLLTCDADPWGEASIVFQPDFEALKAKVPQKNALRLSSSWPPTPRTIKATASIAMVILALYGYAG